MTISIPRPARASRSGGGLRRRLFPPAFHLMAASCGFLCLGTSCRLFPEWESVTVRLPEAPTAWADCGPAPAWEVRAVWPGGEARAETGPPIRLTLPRGETASVLAYPVWAGKELRPGGALYPLDGAGSLALTWEGGYRAEAARVLIHAGVDPGRFDLDRFAREAVVRLGDPWLRPPAVFAESLAAETFRVNWLDPPPLFAVSALGLPGPAASESPFGPSLVPDGEGRADISLPPGVHRWYAAWGRVSVEVDEDGEAVWAVTVNSGQ